MAILFDGCDPGDPCCTTLFDIAVEIETIATTAVNTCIGGACENLIEGFVIVGRNVNIPVANYVAVSLSSLGVSPGSTQQRTGSIILPKMRGVFQVRLLESDYYLAIASDNEEPLIAPPELITEQSMYAYAHGEAMYRALFDAVTVTSRQQGVLGCVSCSGTISDLVPVEPSGNTVGWQTTITVDVEMRGC